MKKPAVWIFITLLMYVILPGIIYAQNADTNLVVKQLKSTEQYYNNKITDQSRLFNGIKYLPYRNQDYVGNGYYNTTELQNAYIRYDDVDFYDIPVLYDLHKDLLILRRSNDQGYMSLLNTKLDKFIINNHTFIKVVADSAEKKIKTGFYDLLHDGQLQLLAKHTKAVEVEKSGITIRNVFVPYTRYFLRKENAYYDISGKNDMLKVLKDKKQELEQYIKANNLSFKNENLEPSLIKLTNHYNQLTR
ncbi:MAG: hypothetical protein EOP47_02875 [Sphingobacteriaceae bacterium]|nr:MAG: hypothetical protein EOP47_02875 [Sphingobacteriaceae bacterium]